MLKAVTVTVMLHQGQQHSESLSPSYIRSFHVLGNTIFRYNYFQYWALGMLFKIEPIIFLSSIKCVVKCFSVCFFFLLSDPHSLTLSSTSFILLYSAGIPKGFFFLDLRYVFTVKLVVLNLHQRSKFKHIINRNIFVYLLLPLTAVLMAESWTRFSDPVSRFDKFSPRKPAWFRSSS